MFDVFLMWGLSIYLFFGVFFSFLVILELFRVPIGRQHLSGGLVLLRLFGHHSHAHAAFVGGDWLHADLPMNRPDGSEKLLPKGLALHDVEAGVDAAVGVAHADGDVVGVGESQAGLLDP